MARVRTRKRPCTICRKWFLPDHRQVGRQKTCANPACRREHHRRQCRSWNSKNREYFKEQYLSTKLERTREPPVSSKENLASVTPRSRIKLCLPEKVMVQIISPEQIVLMEYLIEQILRRTVQSRPWRCHNSSKDFKSHDWHNPLLSNAISARKSESVFKTHGEDKPLKYNKILAE